MAKPKVKSFSKVQPMVYAYSTPSVPNHKGWLKIGYTEKQTPEERVAQQAHTIGVDTKLEWARPAQYTDGSGKYFSDHKFHHYLQSVKKIRRQKGTEWFEIGVKESESFFTDFAAKKTKIGGGNEYVLRKEQQQAVDKTAEYFLNGGTEFLWNAKPRFGKTLTAYTLAITMGFRDVLIVTNRPAVANSWADDFFDYIDGKTIDENGNKIAVQYDFVSATDSLDGREGVKTRDEHIKGVIEAEEGKEKGMIAFISLQDLKGSVYFGGTYDKLKWLTEVKFDLLIVDESQEGVETYKTYRAFKKLQRSHTLFLSGTPFKALASDRFKEEQIFNWTYANEQNAKKNWDEEVLNMASEEDRENATENPYQFLPKLTMYTYQMSEMIKDFIKKGIELGKDRSTYDYAFDLAEFFKTNESGNFIHEDAVKFFINALSTQEKYPYSSEELRNELSHTIWILNRVDSCKALAKLLRNDPVFKEYNVIIAAGDGEESADENQLFVQDYKSFKKSYDKVRKAIDEHDKTITLSVGQLTVGVTIPEWSGVLMLCNLKSASSYMQAAFRCQNPCLYKKADGMYRKDTAYVFDFDPARTLIVFDDFANNLMIDTVGGKGTSGQRKANIRELLNFFPVLGEDSKGEMVELDENKVLSIPGRIKCEEVVKSQFMCNFLFQNISNVFASSAVKDIITKLSEAEDKYGNQKKEEKHTYDDINVDDDGEVIVTGEQVIGVDPDVFGDKIYGILGDDLTSITNTFTGNNGKDISGTTRELYNNVTKVVNDTIQTCIDPSLGLKKSDKVKIGKEITGEFVDRVEDSKQDFIQDVKVANTEYLNATKNATDIEKAAAEKARDKKIEESNKKFVDSVKDISNDFIKDTPQKINEKVEKKVKEAEKHTAEDEIKAHLRGFARTIPSFLMAYGNKNLTLANFHTYTEPDVFKDVTGITIEDFIYLRDGGNRMNPETGQMEHFNGNIFDEVVFNDSIQEFLRKKDELANYFDESQTEDIFSYIPPQKTNQIYTPQWVVKLMVDELEKNNPGCFDDPNKTFADLYMKSGLYITEIVKRLYRSEKMKELIPDNGERIHHILENQVFGMAPTRIIYLIATNYILGFDESLKEAHTNFVQADAAEAAKNGTLEQLVKECFGDRV